VSARPKVSPIAKEGQGPAAGEAAASGGGGVTVAKQRKKSAFGRRGTFDEVYPEIKAIAVQVREMGEGSSGRTSRYGTFPGDRLPCSNPSCVKGGFLIGGLLDSIVYVRRSGARSLREGTGETTISCDGNEGSARLKKRCLNSAHVSISVSYQGGG